MKANHILAVSPKPNPPRTQGIFGTCGKYFSGFETSPGGISDFFHNLPLASGRFPALFADRDWIFSDRFIAFVDIHAPFFQLEDEIDNCLDWFLSSGCLGWLFARLLNWTDRSWLSFG
jgi:hypothetical protein